MTFIDLSTGWCKRLEVPSVDKTSARIFRLFNQIRLNMIPRTKRVRFNNSLEFKKYLIQLLKDFGVKLSLLQLKISNLMRL